MKENLKSVLRIMLSIYHIFKAYLSAVPSVGVILITCDVIFFALELDKVIFIAVKSNTVDSHKAILQVACALYDLSHPIHVL